MTVIALMSAKGSPGVTTSALALAWVWPLVHPGRAVLVVDADPAGGGVAAGYLQASVPAGGGILGWAADRRPESDSLWHNAVPLHDDGTRWLLAGIHDPAQAASVAPAWDRLAAELVTGSLSRADELGKPVDVILDLGRLGAQHEHAALLAVGDLTLIVSRSSLSSVAAAWPVLQRLRDERLQRAGLGVLGCLLVGERQPYRRNEISLALGVGVHGVLAMDSTSAAVFSDGAPPRSGFARSALLRSARSVAIDLRAAPPAEQPIGAGRSHG